MNLTPVISAQMPATSSNLGRRVAHEATRRDSSRSEIRTRTSEKPRTRWASFTRRMNRFLYGIPNQLATKKFGLVHLALVLMCSCMFYIFLSRLSAQ